MLLTGTNGQLGQDLLALLDQDTAYKAITTRREDLDIADGEAVSSFVEEVRPSVIVNSAAMTDVDGCESDPETAFAVNASGARHLAAAAEAINAKLVHISTDYVFDGTKDGAYTEDDPPNPVNAYGASKLKGEELVRSACSRHFIVRTAWLYGQHGFNFVKTMLRLAQTHERLQVVDDQRGSPTWTRDLARQIQALISAGYYGTYHATSQGSCSWYAFAKAIFQELDISVEVDPVVSEAFPRPARRPQNSVLDNQCLRDHNLGIMPHWTDALRRFLDVADQEELTP